MSPCFPRCAPRFPSDLSHIRLTLTGKSLIREIVSCEERQYSITSPFAISFLWKGDFFSLNWHFLLKGSWHGESCAHLHSLWDTVPLDSGFGIIQINYLQQNPSPFISTEETDFLIREIGEKAGILLLPYLFIGHKFQYHVPKSVHQGLEI